MKKLFYFTVLAYCTIGILSACKKDKEDPATYFQNTTWNGFFVHASSLPSTEEPFCMRFRSKDSLVFDYLDGTLAGAYSLTSSGQKLHIDLNKGELVMEATIKGRDSLVAFDNIQTGKYSFRRAYPVTENAGVPTGDWNGTYSIASSLGMNFLSATQVQMRSLVFASGSWINSYSYSGNIIRVDASNSIVGRYFGIIKDSVMNGSFKSVGSSPRMSFLLKKRS